MQLTFKYFVDCTCTKCCNILKARVHEDDEETIWVEPCKHCAKIEKEKLIEMLQCIKEE